jgi:hypothetical protein
MTIPDVLDGAIAVIKAAPASVLAVAATFVVPVELVAAWVQRDTLASRGLLDALSSSSSSSSSGISDSTVVLFAVNGLVLALVTGAVAQLMSSWFAETPVSSREAIRAALHRAPALLAAWVLVHLAEAVGLLGIVVGALFVMPLFLVTSPAIAVERIGPIAGMKRSLQLTKTRYGFVFWVGILIAIVDLILTVALSGASIVFSVFSWGWVLDAAFRAASSLVTVPFVAAAATLVYLDLRIRSEGLDLELGIAEHFDSAG